MMLCLLRRANGIIGAKRQMESLCLCAILLGQVSKAKIKSFRDFCLWKSLLKMEK